ncbi:hypothetical protein ABZZ74_21245 [Streptomyces sp. NPDC006476]|uniref:hypothetical protein n=1 Tax=Streptomyces sp. NPDC006476 TaxID=3157175 RepID=UPI0033A7D092
MDRRTRQPGDGRRCPHAFIALDAPLRARYIRVTGGRMPFDGVFAVSGVRVFGTSDGASPSPVRARARRVDGRTARIEWDATSRATGYNIRYGRHPEKLYHSWLVYERTCLDLRSLNADGVLGGRGRVRRRRHRTRRDVATQEDTHRKIVLIPRPGPETATPTSGRPSG